ncbi:MAG: hypothetical protein U1E60_09530 [Reyranellaceae bacterium]
MRRAVASQKVDVETDAVAAVNDLRNINDDALVIRDDTTTLRSQRTARHLQKVGGFWISAAEHNGLRAAYSQS